MTILCKIKYLLKLLKTAKNSRLFKIRKSQRRLFLNIRNMAMIIKILFKLNGNVIFLPHVSSGYRSGESLCLQLDVER